MTDDLEVCHACQKPKRSNASASLTQWIATCVCDLAPDSTDKDSLDICQSCGKRIGQARQGSFTQYIFRPNYCSCQKPQRVETKFRDFYQAPEAEEEFLSEEDLLPLGKEEFPIDRYKPYKILGQGANSTVYFCQDSILNKSVAVKIMNSLQSQDLMDFQEEARSTSKLKHPLVIEILDFGVTKTNVPYMVLEYFNGETLQSFLKEHDKLEWRLALAILIEVCIALSYSHSHGIMHRDIKPGNILIKIDSDGYPLVKVIDFGLAALNKSNDETVAGTPSYMSPDIPCGRNYTESSEVYSCGILLYELLTGNLPYEGLNAIEILNAHANNPIPHVSDSVDIPETIDQIVFQSMAKDPADRFASTNELRTALENCFELYDKQDQRITKTSTIQGIKTTFFAALPFMFLVLILGGSFYFFNNILKESKHGNVKVKTSVKKKKVEELFSIYEQDGQLVVTGKNEFNDDDLSRLRRRLDGKERIKLRFVKKNIDGTGFKYLVNLPIEELILDFCTLNAESGKFVKEMRMLDVLILRNCDITDDFIVNIGIHPNITMLEIGGSELTDKSIPYIARFPKIDNVALSSAKITDKSLAYLANCPTIQSLSVNHNDITSTGIKELVKLPYLTYLDVSSTNNQNKACLIAISKMPNLHQIKLGGHLNFEPKDLLILNQSKTIRIVKLSELRPISKYLPYLTKLSKLHKIDIGDSDLADSDLHLFSKMKNLKSLQLGMSPRLTRKAAEEFAKKQPKGFNFKYAVLDKSYDRYLKFLE